MNLSKLLTGTDCLHNGYCDEIYLMDRIPYITLLAAILFIFSKCLLQYADG